LEVREMLVTLAAIGVLAILAWFIRAIGLRRINVEFERKPLVFRTSRNLEENEKPPKQLNK
jgi:hypothetical protein